MIVFIVRALTQQHFWAETAISGQRTQCSPNRSIAPGEPVGETVNYLDSLSFCLAADATSRFPLVLNLLRIALKLRSATPSILPRKNHLASELLDGIRAIRFAKNSELADETTSFKSRRT